MCEWFDVTFGVFFPTQTMRNPFSVELIPEIYTVEAKIMCGYFFPFLFY